MSQQTDDASEQSSKVLRGGAVCVCVCVCVSNWMSSIASVIEEIVVDWEFLPKVPTRPSELLAKKRLIERLQARSTPLD